MKEYPVLFTGEMVRAIIEGRKTQTRRVIKPQPMRNEWDVMTWRSRKRWMEHGSPLQLSNCPFGDRGDRLWVRETFTHDGLSKVAHYRATEELPDIVNEMTGKWVPWQPSIYMPRWASRITLEIVGVRVERVQEISEDDCCHETGAPLKWGGPGPEPYTRNMLGSFSDLWDSINAKRGFGWDVNPWVWVIEFKKVEMD